MKQRNPAANCGNCPYGTPSTAYDAPHIECRRYGVAQDGFPIWYPQTWCGEHPDFWQEDEAPDEPRAWGDGVTEAIRRKPTLADAIDATAKQWCAGPKMNDALEKANAELADLRERHERLRAHCDGIAEKVRGLSVLGYGVETVRRDDVLAIIEGDKP